MSPLRGLLGGGGFQFFLDGLGGIEADEGPGLGLCGAEVDPHGGGVLGEAGEAEWGMPRDT